MKTRTYSIIAVIVVLIALSVWLVAYYQDGEEADGSLATTTAQTSVSKRAGVSSLVGSYFTPVTTEVNDIDTGESVPWKTDNLLTIDALTDETVSYSFFVNGSNYHSCSHEGQASKRKGATTYEEVILSDGGSCVLDLTVKADAFSLAEVDAPGNTCANICGTRAEVDTVEFKFADATTTRAVREVSEE